ncbi:MAG: cytochrome c3 family protein, partial [Thermodesulfobacteriota bacterium]
MGNGGPSGLRLRLCLVLSALMGLSILPPLPASGVGIVSSRHNLSAGGPGSVKAGTETEICIFCHTPHYGASVAPLWNRYSSGATYIPYGSSTAISRPGQPTGASKLCLSCHDGTVALGSIRSRGAPIPMQGGIGVIPPGATRLGTDLSDDHPVSFTYDAGLAAANGQLYNPSTLTGRVRLDENGELQCTSCHDPHNDQYGKFRVMSNSASALCTTCHNKTYWSAGIHKTASGGHGGSTWNGQPPDPWPHTEETTIVGNGCENCHTPHNAGTGQRLLNFPGNEQNCYSCHNGNVVLRNIQAEFNKVSVHPVSTTSGLHDPSEDLVNPPRHVTCVDCHNPHAARINHCTDCHVPAHGIESITASGLLKGVRGVNASGTAVDPITYQYELCFRCHADSVNRGPARVPRQFVQTNTRLAFATSNASYHPVITTGKNPVVPSLISPYTTAAQITCTACHSNNRGVGGHVGPGPTGPHGSDYVPLLERRQELTDFQGESSAVYALCYKCHSRTSILSDVSFTRHNLHVVTRTTACTTCHDPHGVTTVPRLINFNTTYVTASSGGQLRFDA